MNLLEKPKPLTTTALATNANLGTMTGGGPVGKLPSWLSTDTDSLVGDLMKELGGVGGAFDTKPVARSFKSAIQTTRGMGGQIAENAMNESIARGGMEGGAVNSGMVKAQSMLPVYSAVSGLKTDKAQAIAGMKEREMAMRTNLASTIGSMRVNYLSMLSDVYLRSAGLSLQAEDSRRGHDRADKALSEQTEAQKQSQALAAAQAVLAQKQMTGGWTTSALGTVIDGHDQYNKSKAEGASRAAATATLNRLAGGY